MYSVLYDIYSQAKQYFLIMLCYVVHCSSTKLPRHFGGGHLQLCSFNMIDNTSPWI